MTTSNAHDLKGQRFGKLVVQNMTKERIKRYIGWECLCDCGRTIAVPSTYLTRGTTTMCKTCQVSDLKDKRFGKLVVQKMLEERRSGNIVWECLCDCGKSVNVIAGSLNSGNTQSCGCSRIDKVTKDLTEQRFHNLVAKKPTTTREHGSIVWECLCDCGEVVFFPSTYLLHGYVRSCKNCAIHGGMHDLTGQKFGRLTVIELSDKKVIEDKNRVSWKCLCRCGNKIDVTAVQLTLGKTTSCGCLVRELGIARMEAIRKKNLTKHYEGTMVTGLNDTLFSSNTSGVRGVYFHKATKLWYASMKFKGKHIWLGSYPTKLEAKQARKVAEEVYWEPLLEKYN